MTADPGVPLPVALNLDEIEADLQTLRDERVLETDPSRWYAARARTRQAVRPLVAEVRRLQAELAEAEDHSCYGCKGAEARLAGFGGITPEQAHQAVAAKARVERVEAEIEQILLPINMLRHGVDCSMRQAIYDGARCTCRLMSKIHDEVGGRLRAALAADEEAKP